MILLITSNRYTALNYHRQLVPFSTLELPYQEVKELTEDIDFSKYKWVSFLRCINTDGKTFEIVDKIKKAGAKVHIDIDDYWELPITHGLYQQYTDKKIAQQTIDSLNLADLVTTTTTILAEKILPINSNVEVLPNAVNPDDENWQVTPTESDICRIGYIAGLWHYEDIHLIRPDLKKLYTSRELNNKYQIRPAGFNLIKQGESVYMNEYYKTIERMFTFDYRYVSAENRAYLTNNTPNHNEKFFSENYQRIWGALDVHKYPKLYNEIDVSLVPLFKSEFSRCKSELKLIEAGFMRKPCIVSYVEPYTLLATKQNSYTVTGKAHDTFFIGMRNLILNKSMREDLASQLYEDVKVKHHIKTVNVKRKQLLA